MSGMKEQLLRRKPTAMRGSHSGPDLKPSFGTFQLMMFGVGATVGTGIFFVLPESVPEAGPAVVLSFLIAGIGAGLSAICYAEMAAAIPVSGSTYSYAYHGLGEFAAVFVAACVLLEYGISCAAVAVGWSGYLNNLIDALFGVHLPAALSHAPIAHDVGDPTGLINLPAVVLVWLCTLLLLRGASESAKANTIMVLIKVGVLLMFAIIALTAFQADRFQGFFDAGPKGIGAAAAVIFFSFIGLDAISTAGEEVKDPQKALPRAIMGALAIVVGIYLLVAIAGIGAQPLSRFEDADQQEAGLSVMLFDITGSAIPGTILAAGAVISIFSVTLVSLYGQTRILFAMGRDRMMSEKFAEVNPRTMVPSFNTIVVAIVVSCIAGFVPSGYLWDVVSIGTLIAFSAVALAVMVLRKTDPDMPRPFKVPGYPVTPILTVIVCAYILYGLPPFTWLVFFVWLAVVVAFYFLWGMKNSKLNAIATGREVDPTVSSVVHDLGTEFHGEPGTDDKDGEGR